MKEQRRWKPERLFMEDYWSLGPSEVEFFEAICALAGSTKGCELGFKRAFVGADVWRRIFLLYAHLLAAAQRKAFPVRGDLSHYPNTASEVRPEIENRLRCYVSFRELVCFSLVEKIAVPWELQTALGMYQFRFPLPSSVSVSIGKDKRSIGGKCVVSGITFPPDFEVRLDALPKRDHALASVQAAAYVLRHLNPSITKKELNAKIRGLPVIAEIAREFYGEHTLRDWIKTVTPGESKKGRPSKHQFSSSPPRSLELPLNQTLPLYAPHAREMERYLACLKTTLNAIAATLASETALSEDEICSHALMLEQLDPVCIQVNFIEKKFEWARAWILTVIEQVRRK